ncbi:hypothetical protein [Pectobacterium brasiliense]|uniref:hypothetical protein n=1 Tax=Pectobacterium brasiliense TaxID=180957 RepID=UPI0025A1F9E0|nr:hypothetical protein [Pectobacterium brasiliense]WJM80427.1 hypothetical protein QTI90_19460 [Pectobacterium brasiliense]
MQYKVSFHAFIQGKKQNIDATFESENEPKLTDHVVIKAVMHSLSEVVDVDTPVFSINFHIETIVRLA